jgi:hypothetical protein
VAKRLLKVLFKRTASQAAEKVKVLHLGLAQGFSPAKNSAIQGALAPGLPFINRKIIIFRNLFNRWSALFPSRDTPQTRNQILAKICRGQ